MKIEINPTWSFLDALDATWRAKPSSPEHVVMERIRALEEWANLVGRETASQQLRSVVEKYPNLSAASADLRLSFYTLMRLSRSFSETHPDATSTSPSWDLFIFLTTLPDLVVDSDVSFISEAVPPLAVSLGYAESEVYFEAPIQDGAMRYRADAMFAPQGTAYPVVMLEVRRETVSFDRLHNAITQVKRHRSVIPSSVGAVISSNHIALVRDSFPEVYELRHLSFEQAERIDAALRRPLASAMPAAPPSPAANDQIQLLLERVTNAQSNDDKKRSLEDLAAQVFNAHTFLRCKYRNLLTHSSEIDIVCEILDPRKVLFLSKHGRYFLVECKNWAVPVGAKDIRDFLGKLRKSRVRLGVYFARNGITGERNGTDALRAYPGRADRISQPSLGAALGATRKSHSCGATRSNDAMRPSSAVWRRETYRDRLLEKYTRRMTKMEPA